MYPNPRLLKCPYCDHYLPSHPQSPEEKGCCGGEGPFGGDCDCEWLPADIEQHYRPKVTKRVDDETGSE